MKTIKKVLASAAVSMMMMVGAQAANVNFSGVILDPLSPFDFSGTTAAIFQNIDPITGALSGYGTITRINNTDSATFCPGCELTVVFDGYIPDPLSAFLVPTIGGVAQTIKYTGGSVRLYVDNGSGGTLSTTGGSTATLASASDGLLWLGMTGHADAAGDTLTGENTYNTTRTLNGKGSLDVVAGAGGGAAGPFLNTNTRPLLPTQLVGADLSFTASFTTFLTVVGGVPVFAFGSGNFDGDTQVPVPEPTSLALLGLGFAGIAAMRRRKTAAAQ